MPQFLKKIEKNCRFGETKKDFLNLQFSKQVEKNCRLKKFLQIFSATILKTSRKEL